MNSKKVLIERNSYQCQDPPEAIVLRWVSAETEYECVGFDKYQKVIQQKCIVSETCSCKPDDPISSECWTFTGEVRRGELLEKNSPSCSYVPPAKEKIYRWNVDFIECDGCDKYSNETKQFWDYDKWVNVEPLETRRIMIERNSSECIDDPTQSTQFRWIPSGYTCVGYSKFQILAQQKCISSETCSCLSTSPCWVNTGLTKRGDRLEEYSIDCGYYNPIYKWFDDDSYVFCSDNNLYKYSIKKVSIDSGETWNDVIEYSYSCNTCGYEGTYEDVFDRCPNCGSTDKENLDTGHTVSGQVQCIEENSEQCLKDACCFTLNTDAESVSFYIDGIDYPISSTTVVNGKAELTKEDVRFLESQLGVEEITSVYAEPYHEDYSYTPKRVTIDCNGNADAYHSDCGDINISPSNAIGGCSGGTVTFIIIND